MMSNKPPVWIGVGLAFYAFIAIAIAEGGLGVLLPSILTTYHLTTATVTALFFSQISGYVVAALTSSLLSQRIGLARMILLAAISLTTALCIYAATPHWLVMVITGTLLGLGIGLIDAGINTFIAHKQDSAHLMGVLHAFYGVGALTGPAIATLLLTTGVSWRSVYWVFAAMVGLLVIGMIWVIAQPYPLIDSSAIPAEQSAGKNLRLALKTPTVRVAGLLLLVYVGTEASLGNWAYTVQTVSRGTPVALAGYSVAAYWFGLTLGRLTMGQLMKRLGAARLIDGSLALLTVGLLIWWWFPQQLWSLPIIGFALAAIFPTTMWLMPRRVPAALVPAAIGFAASIGSIGAVGIPTIVGWLADQTNLEVVPIFMVPLALVMVMLHRWLVDHTQTPSPEEV
ncbi:MULTISPECIES: MFS transporter [unclassified Leptolyngbya]|uniref:MFS transporter n=1 Tax=unclassified Leptolyngbya TaxID=2650499 RepID=UPI00168703C3|nr:MULTISPECIES: MFS transporter [unclassified Leptolyngbya]MBD1909080.1 MFS transporter [Leptolyngbya sp. FACHB-8]MBD2157009.1 MFS transporter [Leptolyngbya sp. FACHB-16]